MWILPSAFRRRGRGALEVVACLLLFGSLGVAAGSARAVTPSESPPLAGPRPTPAGPLGKAPACGHAADALPSEPDMQLIPAGAYRSFFKREGRVQTSPVAPFLLDVLPVSRVGFAEFVRADPRFARSRMKRVFAEEAYLRDWSADDEPGGVGDAPVTFVSWFAARAYCECQGKRLPTLAEWERVASAGDAPRGDAAAGEQRGRFGFATAPLAPSAGWPRFGSIWEWTEDFDGAVVSGRPGDPANANLFCGAGVRAADASDYGGFLRYSFRSSLKAAYALKNLGFRCAREPE